MTASRALDARAHAASVYADRRASDTRRRVKRISMSRPYEALPPVFIFSSARSGSTLLRYIVDTHPAICCPAELNLGSLCEGLYWAAFDTIGQVAEVSCEAERESVAIREVRRITAGLMNRYAEAKGKQIWCEKTPLNLVHRELLGEVFPEARRICLYRNCMDVVHSCLEFSQQKYVGELDPYFHRYPDNHVTALVSYWVDRAQMLLDVEERNGDRCFRIKYEDLVRSPADALPPMFEFLGVDWNPSMLDSVFTAAHEKGDGDPKVLYTKSIRRASVGKGSSVPLRRVADDLLRKMNELLAQIGYPTLEAPDT
jgi:hypothetical protein